MRGCTGAGPSADVTKVAHTICGAAGIGSLALGDDWEWRHQLAAHGQSQHLAPTVAMATREIGAHDEYSP